MITIKTFTASIDCNLIAELAKLRILVFRDYPVGNDTQTEHLEIPPLLICA